MKRLSMLIPLTCLLATTALFAEDSAPKVGSDAPAFKLPGSDGKMYSLDDFKGKKALVIAWYPVAFTGG